MSFKLLIVSVLVLILSSCNSQKQPEHTIAADSVAVEEAISTQLPISEDEYMIIANGQNVALREWETQVDLKAALGAPASQTVKELGEGADTHAGASIKTLTYPGLKMELYIPGQKDTGWIMNMNVTGSQYQTARGSKVGDPVEEVKKRYPEGAVFPDGRKSKSQYAWYIADEGNYLTLKFEIDNGKVKEIRLYHELP